VSEEIRPRLEELTVLGSDAGAINLNAHPTPSFRKSASPLVGIYSRTVPLPKVADSSSSKAAGPRLRFRPE
jgi:hypothetical protein